VTLEQIHTRFLRYLVIVTDADIEDSLQPLTELQERRCLTLVEVVSNPVENLTCIALELLCIIIEILTPTVGLLAGLGVAAMLYSVVLTLGGDVDAVYALLASLAIAVLVFAVFVKRMPSSRLWKKLVLSDASTKERGYVSAPPKQELVGRTGIAETDLRPSGRGSFDGVSQDIVADGAYIVKGSSIIVAAVEGSRVIVRKVE
jgi:membrane-bound serine protease (ClpP class)